MSAMVETMAYAGELPWHGLGVKVEHNLTPQEKQKEEHFRRKDYHGL